MSYTLGINSLLNYKYSSDNKYAQEYYNACKELATAQYQVSNCDDPNKLKALLDKRDYLKKKVPEITMKARKEENRLESSNDNEQHKINYLA